MGSRPASHYSTSSVVSMFLCMYVQTAVGIIYHSNDATTQRLVTNWRERVLALTGLHTTRPSASEADIPVLNSGPVLVLL